LIEATEDRLAVHRMPWNGASNRARLLQTFPGSLRELESSLQAELRALIVEMYGA
jgi:hypothetical protein